MPYITDDEYKKLKEKTLSKTDEWLEDLETLGECSFWPAMLLLILISVFFFRDEIGHWMGWW